MEGKKGGKSKEVTEKRRKGGWQKENKGERGGGREGGERKATQRREGEKKEGKWCKVKKSKLMANKLSEVTGSLSILIGLKMKSMSTYHTQQSFNFNLLINLLVCTLFSF